MGIIVRHVCWGTHRTPPPPPSAGVGKPPHGLGGCIWTHLVNGTGHSPVSGTADPPE